VNELLSSVIYDIMGYRYNIHSQLEHLQSKYIGTGHADTSRFDWIVNQHRDSNASYLGHHDLLNYFAIAENESKARIRFNMMEKLLQPCGAPPDKPEDWTKLNHIQLHSILSTLLLWTSKLTHFYPFTSNPHNCLSNATEFYTKTANHLNC